jgi:hypothetical protein
MEKEDRTKLITPIVVIIILAIMGYIGYIAIEKNLMTIELPGITTPVPEKDNPTNKEKGIEPQDREELTKKDNPTNKEKGIEPQDREELTKKDRLKAYIEEKHPIVYDELLTLVLDSVFDAEEKYGIDAIILLAVIDVESDFNPLAKATKKYDKSTVVTGVGLMQINPNVWLKEFPELTMKSLYSPKINIDVGAKILHKYLKACEGKGINMYKCALTKYFGGTNPAYYLKVVQDIGEFYIYTN